MAVPSLPSDPTRLGGPVLPWLVRLLSLALVLTAGLPVLAGVAQAADPSVPLSGRVTDRTGKAVAGTAVAVHDLDQGGAVVATATPNGEGRYSVADLPAGEYDVVATPPVDAPGALATVTSHLSLGHGDEVVDLVLPPATVTGRVTHSDGSPAPGALLVVDASPRHRATAYADGTFRLALGDGEWEVEARPATGDASLDVSAVRSFTVAGSGPVDASVALARPTVRGTVLAPDGTTAVAGATVSLVATSGRNQETTSRSDGSFGFAAQPGEHRLEVEPPVVNPFGWVRDQGPTFTVTRDHSPAAPLVVDARLSGPTLTGVVRSPSGAPVPRASLQAKSPAGWTYARADAAGQYGLDVPAGTVEVTVAPPRDSAEMLARTVSLDLGTLPAVRDLELARPNVAGRALTPEGLPVRNAEVEAYGPGHAGEHTTWVPTDRDGRFGLLLPAATDQRIVVSPVAGDTGVVRTARVASVPATGHLDGFDVTLAAAPAAAYDVAAMPVSIDGQAARATEQPVISADGNVVAVVAATQVTCDCDTRQDVPSATSTDGPSATGVVLHDRTTGEDEPLRAAGRLVIPDGRIALSGDGRTVAFVTRQEGLIEDDEDGDLDAFVLDRRTGTLTRIAPVTGADWSQRTAVLSGDGRRLVLVAETAPTEQTPQTDQVVVVELGATGAETGRRVVGDTGAAGVLADLSRDGRVLAWTSYAADAWTLQVLDLVTGERDQPRPFSAGFQVWNGTFAAPSLSDDGSVVAYGTLRDSVDHGPSGAVRTARRTAATDRVVGLFAADGGPRGSGVSDFVLAGDGASLLVASPGAHPEEWATQAWVVDLADDSAELVSRTAAGRPAAQGVYRIAAPSSFSTLALQTSSKDLSGTSNAFVVLATGEVVPPTWPAGAALTSVASGLGATTATLEWTEATDNVAVTGYRVLSGDTVVGATPAATRRLRLTGLQPGTSHTFRVEAVDGRGSVSTGGPTVTVRTLADDSTELRPLEATGSTGGVATLAWEAPPGAEAIVLRRLVGETVVAERTLPADATTATERGLAAATTHTFQLFARTGGVLKPWTRTATVAVPALSLGDVSWSVDTVRPDVARYGSTASLSVAAESGRLVTAAVTHLSWYDEAHRLLDTPREVTSVVPLTEAVDAPGTYRGGFVLADGIAGIRSVRGTVSDGQGGSLEKAATRAPVTVSSHLAVTVDAPAGALVWSSVQVSSETANQSRVGRADGGTSMVFDDLLAADDYVVRFVDDRGTTRARATGLMVRGGLAAAATLEPPLDATLEISFRDERGDAVTGTEVLLRDAGTKEFLALRETDRTGGVSFDGLLEGTEVSAEVRFDADQLFVAEQARVITLTRGTNHLDVTVRDLPRSTLTGVVRDEAGQPVAGASVELRQLHNGQVRSERTTSAVDGTYEVTGLRRSASLTVRKDALAAEVELDLGAARVSRDVSLFGPRLYRVDLRIFTRAPGAEEIGPARLDPATFLGLGLAISIDGETRYADIQPSTTSGTTAQLTARPGQVVRLCRYGSACAQATLGTGTEPTSIELHTSDPVRINAEVRDVATDARVAPVFATLHRVGDAGRELVSRSTMWSSTLRLDAPGAGRYALVVSSSSGTSVERALSIDPGQPGVDLGVLRLSHRAHFRNTEDRVVATRPEVLPGGDVDLRATWTNAATGLSDVVARVSVPQGSTLVPGSLLLDGRPVQGTAGDGYVDVALGDVPTSGTGTLRYRLEAAPSLAGTDGAGLSAGVELRWPGGAETLAPAVVGIAGVTIGGPAVSTTLRVPVSGRAPAGSLVSISDAGVVIGETLTGPGGYWSTAVTVTERRTQPRHSLVAATVVAGQRLDAEHVVDVDPNRPVVARLSLFQGSEAAPVRRVDLDPREGVARFPFVFSPYQSTGVVVGFDAPELVTRAETIIGDERIPMTRRDDGTWLAATSSSTLQGPIRVDFDADPRPMSLEGDDSGEQEVRDSLPSPLSDFVVSDVVQPDTSGTGPRTGSFTMSLPSQPGGYARVTMTTTRETYTPTAADLETARGTGAPVYAASATRSGNTLTLSMVVPDPAAGRRSGGPGLSAVRESLQWAFFGATSLDSFVSAVTSGGKYKDLRKALDVADGCSPAKRAEYTDRASDIALAALLGDIGGAAFSIASTVFAPATFGLGSLALGLLGVALDKALSYGIEKLTSDLVEEMKGDKDCTPPDDPKRPKDPPPPAATPVWIYDPSGYVYEGARTERVGGVTATLLTAPTADGPWEPWDAEWYGQTNPQQTGTDGRYGWDVPEGWWKVRWTKSGYRPEESRVLRVLPPHFDVDVSMTKEGLPTVTSARVAEKGVVDLGFDRLVRTASTRGDGVLSVVDADGRLVTGTWTTTDPATGDDDRLLQRGARFTPASAPAVGTVLTVTVDGVADHSGNLMREPYSVELTVPAGTEGAAGVPEAPGPVTATAGERRATVAWAAPDDHGSPLVDYVVTAQPGGAQVTVPSSQRQTEVAGLSAGTAYTFTVTARNGVGTGAASAPTAPVVPTAVAPETTLTGGPAEGAVVASRSASLAWATTGSSYACTLDGAPFGCSGTSVALTKLRSGTHTFSVAARDAEGDVDATPATRTWVVPRDDRTLDRGRGWRTWTDTKSFEGTYLEARRRGTSLTTRVQDATGLALVVGGGRHHGRVRVWIGRHRIGTVSLSTRSYQNARVVDLGSFAKARSGVVRIEVVSRGKVVRVDGLAVRQ
ncbi:carboxypeptidase regulatory-like domain-containing protein [Nocardioides flavescens]|uniref:Fibronectin type-III domain-containing protein n=1 Tax=Nocardioides flavescens TaxID=2691959 RepID=A0A6L7F054_9ACTN|nr:carboxypeptidase regulatory-like domain-containing protein [Nocardioides flavescens]MXG90375.1 hypothetical protein [Nocardioides flavescens]